MDELHPELRKWRFAPPMTITPGRIRVMRRITDRLVRVMNGRLGVTDGVEIADEVVLAPQGHHVGVRVYEPAGSTEARPTLLWIHGGGLILGSNRDDFLCSHYVSELGIAVVSVDYRLAPEHRFPAALDDLAAAAEWIRADERQGRFEGSRLLVGGASAGGGLAAALAARLHDDGRPPIGQVLIYPMLDDRTAARDDIGPKDHRVWNNVSNHTGWSSYIGAEPGSAGISPRAAPARRLDLADLAPAWIGVGTIDLFHDEDVDYARRLGAAGVDCELQVVDGAFHGFDLLDLDTAISKEFLASHTGFVGRLLGH